MGQDAVGAFAAHRISPARRHGMVLLGTIVLMASLAGMLIGRVSGSA
jgi:hypothetical protein